MSGSIIAVDQGTTGTKAFSLTAEGTFTALFHKEHQQFLPASGHVEHDPEELLSHVTAALAAAPRGIKAAGIDNQGETIIAFDAQTGRPIYNAIVWQDSRSQPLIDKLVADGAEELTLSQAGLPLDPYFSASKMRWIIDNVAEASSLLKAGRLRLATSDAFFLYRLTGRYVTDVTTASRTSLMNLNRCEWDEVLLDLFGIPRVCLPEIVDTTGPIGAARINGREIPLTASVVDQQAALFGHGCASPGDIKITFGTGAFVLAIAGSARPSRTAPGILPTIARRSAGSAPAYALDGGVYNAASAVNWARGLGLFTDYPEISHFTQSPAITRGLAFVPALSGLGCPHWDRRAAGLWIGLGLDTTRTDMMQSLLEGIALRACEVVDAMAETIPLKGAISVDGGLARNEYFIEFLARASGRELRLPEITDLTAYGTARLAMIGAGLCDDDSLPLPAGRLVRAAPLEIGHKQQFAEAIRRAKVWRT